jgi:hypothetical protein
MRLVWCGATMTTMIVSIDGQARGCQDSDRVGVTTDVLTHAVSNLDDTSGWTTTIPSEAHHA